MRRLDIDPTRVELGWIIDFCAQALRNIVIGLGGRTDGYTMQSKFGIAVGSELMAILSVATDLADLKERINNITVAFDKSGKPVTCRDLEVGNAMAAFMRNTINPTLMCTAEYQPCLVHAGPFANIAVGQSSIIADRVGLKLFDYHVTESGFAADIGFEKFWNVKCRSQRPETPCLGADRHDPRPENARRRTQGGGRQGPGRRLHQGEPGTGGKGLSRTWST
jgi:formate--tetrahydrofolate ligase